MPDNFCSRLRNDPENLVCPIYCGVQGTGFPCMQEDNSDCGKYYAPKYLKEEKKFRIEPNYIADY